MDTHIPQADAPHQTTIDVCNAATPNQDSLCRNMDTLHIPMYPRQMDLHQSTIDVCNTTTPNQNNLCRNTDTHIPQADAPINHL